MSRSKLWRRLGAGMSIVVASLAVVACSDGSNEVSHSAAPEQADEPKAEAVHWGYEGHEGPEHWGSLSEDFSVCDSGTEQSPIDLTAPMLTETPSWTERIGGNILTEGERATVMELVNNGHTIQVTNDVPMVAIVDGEQYELVQYHFHAPSEHTIDGRHYPLEVHLVHQSAAGDLAVVGILVEEGEHDALWDIILSGLPEKPGDSRHMQDLDLDTDDIRPPPQTYYQYMGSLTTPPCSENVRWIVSAEIREISSGQMAKILAHLHGNNRPVQPLNARTLELYSPDNEG